MTGIHFPQGAHERLHVYVILRGGFFKVDAGKLAENRVAVTLQELEEGGNADELRFALGRLIPNYDVE